MELGRSVERAIGAMSRALTRPQAALTVTSTDLWKKPPASRVWTASTIDYELGGDAWGSSIVMSAVRWIQRTFTEAPLVVQEWSPATERWDTLRDDPAIALVENPNPAYTGVDMWKAVLADRLITGDAYIRKVRNRLGAPLQLWWLPSSMVTPLGHARLGSRVTSGIEAFQILGYRVSYPGGLTEDLPAEEVIRFPDGIDPRDPLHGLSPLRALWREVYTDEEAGSMTASIMRNLGIPGVVIAPKEGTIPASAAEAIKDAYVAKFTGARRGEPMVMEGSFTLSEFGWSPDQLKLRELRGIPEERISAVLGVSAAVLGLGSGLTATKVGATLREYREEAVESTIVPLYRDLATALTQQLLLPDFYPSTRRRYRFDLTDLRVLGEDERKRQDRILKLVSSGWVTVAEGRRMLGLVVAPEHEIYLRPRALDVVPAGLTVDEQAERAAPAAPAETVEEGADDLPKREPKEEEEEPPREQARRSLVRLNGSTP